MSDEEDEYSSAGYSDGESLQEEEGVECRLAV
jgi:hypothetical protein